MIYRSADILADSLWSIAKTLCGTPAVMSLVTYVLTAVALYTIAKRRGLKNPWLAWIPIADCWLLGSLSDQYQYVVNGQHKYKRKILLTLRILTAVMWACLAGLLVSLCVHVVDSMMWGPTLSASLPSIVHQAANLLMLCLPLIGISIACTVFRYMALYDIYKSLDPANCVLFLVLSILFSVTKPFFLFFSRNKDEGMPPRKQPAQAAPSSNDWVDVQEDEL